jgi:hypothetical protein
MLRCDWYLPEVNSTRDVPHLYLCHSRTTWRDQFIAQLMKHLKDASTTGDLRYTIVNDIHKWILTDDTNEPDEPDPTPKVGWFQVIKGYLPQQWSRTQALFFRAQRLEARCYTGKPWPIQLITFSWTQSPKLWKDRCASAQAPAANNLDKSSACTRQTAQHYVEMAYAHVPSCGSFRDAAAPVNSV